MTDFHGILRVAFTLAHLSDPHLPPMPQVRRRDLIGKRVFGHLNWTRNRHKIHRRDVLDALVADLHTQHPDQIAVTGDLINLALEAEFKPARAWLEQIGSPERVSVIPGNHDAYVRATQHRFSETFGDYACSDKTCSDESLSETGFPFLRRRGPLALIGLSSGLPTPPLMATGKLGPHQRRKLEQLLGQLSQEQAFRVVLVHHPLRSNARMKRLTDSDQLLALLKQYGAELVLHGHDHVHSTIWVDGPANKIPVVGVPSASAIEHHHHPAAAYNLFSIERSGDAWRCEQTVRGMDKDLNVHELRKTQLI